MPGLEELEMLNMVITTSRRKMATKSQEEKMETEILQITRIQMMMMMRKTVKMMTPQMLMDKGCQETTPANKPLPSYHFVNQELNFPLFTKYNFTGTVK